jgi:hypothetical protein
MGVALALALAGATLAWVRAGKPSPQLRGAAHDVVRCLRDPPLAVAAAAVALAGAYSLALLLFTPQNDGDALAYHLPRAMFWRQQHGLGYIPGAADSRLNVNPPNAEIGTLFTMLFSHGDRYVGLVQFGAYVSAAVAVYGIARRLGYEVRAALLGAALFALLPVVALQASSALNDLVVASFLSIAALFLLSSRTSDLVVAATALALALGTKFTAFFGVPLLAAVAVLGPARRRARLLAALAVGAAVAGSVWYGVNLAQTGNPDGGLASSAGQGQKHTVGWIALTFWRLLLDALDLSGTAGADVVAYVAAAALLAAASLVLARRASERLASARAAAVVAAAPFAVIALGIALKAAVQFLLRHAGRADMADVLPGGSFRPSGLADTTRSWYGPTGALLGLGAPLLALRSGRGREGLLRLVLAGAPLVLVAELALVLVYDPWRGRFAAFAFALAAAAWSGLARRRALTWAAVAVAATTLVMSFLHSLGKPSGVGALDVANPDVPTASVWGKPRWYVQTLARSDPSEHSEGAVIRFVQLHVPAHATVALALRENDFVAPYFGASLSRAIRLVHGHGDRPDAAATWLVLSPGAQVSRCRADWTPRVAYPSGWRVEQRTRAGACGAGNG